MAEWRGRSPSIWACCWLRNTWLNRWPKHRPQQGRSLTSQLWVNLSSCHSSSTKKCLKDNWCQCHISHGYPSRLSPLIKKTLSNTTTSGVRMVDLTCFSLIFLLVFISFLIVNPTISEAELYTADLQPYMSGKQQRLTCSSYGQPLPNITWFWQPCPSDLTLTEWVTFTML